MPDREELKNCPFCGGDADAIIILRKQNPNRYFVVCNRCYGRTGEKETKDEAVSAWNRRDSEKKGHWVLTRDEEYEYCRCSECGYDTEENWMIGSKIPYCEQCGSKNYDEETE